MTCPGCGTENQDTAEACASCGVALVLPVGTVLADRYLVEGLLGVGGLGRVYRAHDRMLEEEVAVKVLHPEAARSPEMAHRFRSEIKLARRVRHRNVCAIHEYGEHGGHRFVAMELVDGVDLHRVLHERGPLPPREAYELSIRSPAASPPSTRRGSSTVTSRPRTSCATAGAACACSTSASPSRCSRRARS